MIAKLDTVLWSLLCFYCIEILQVRNRNNKKPTYTVIDILSTEKVGHSTGVSTRSPIPLLCPEKVGLVVP